MKAWQVYSVGKCEPNRYKNTVHHQGFAQPYIMTNAENVPSERVNVGKTELIHGKSADGTRKSLLL